MVLSNLSSNVDVESRAMATMGDTLGRSDAGAGMEVGAPSTPGHESRYRGVEGHGAFPFVWPLWCLLSTC